MDRAEEENRENARKEERCGEEPTPDNICIAGSDPWVVPSTPEQLEKYVEQLKELHRKSCFSSLLMKFIEEKGLDPVAVYKRANMDRKLFSKIRSNIYYTPSKKTVLALALAMELSLDETTTLLNRAGFALSKSILSDVIIEFFITRGNYNLDEINAALYTYDQPILL